MLKNLIIHNFKSWQDTGKMSLASLTGLFGTNSSGKTGILQLLLMLKQTVESSDRPLQYSIQQLISIKTYYICAG